jgi:FolB domain-containing protein
VYPREKLSKQKLLVKVEAELGSDFNPHDLNDDIANTLDYNKIAQIVKDFENKDTNLIETIAIKSCVLILNCDPKIASCRVRVQKMHVINGVKSVAAEYFLSRK